MGIQDSLTYVLINPLTVGTASYMYRAASALPGLIKQKGTMTPPVPPVPLWKLAAASGPYVRLAAISGTAAVILGAYGSHREIVYRTFSGEYAQQDDTTKELKQVFETANRYHFIHTLALLGAPFCRARFLVATCMVSAMIMFCGSCYYYAFTGDKRFSKITPFGGVCFIIGWLGMLL